MDKKNNANEANVSQTHLRSSPKSIEDAARIAEIRFGRISPAFNNTYTEKSETAYFTRISKIPVTFPDGHTRYYSCKTHQKWLSDYRRYGLEGLMPSERKDAGISRALSDEAEDEICRLVNKYPRLPGTRIHARLVEGGFISATVSVDTVQRFIKKNDLRTARNPEVRDRKAFEEDAFGKMWQADTCYFPGIKEDGKDRNVFSVGIIDDCTRLEVDAELFFEDNAENFQRVLKKAIEKYGIPTKLYVDNGSPYANHQLSLICISLGITLIHTRPRDGASKGKIERSWRTHRSDFLADLDVDDIQNLQEFREKWSDYVTKYNTQHVNRVIGCTPYQRYEQVEKHVRIPQSREWLNSCFLNRISRRVYNNSTVSIDNVWYDVPPQFMGMTVEIRYVPGDMSTAFILYEGKRYPIAPTDTTANAHAKRKSSISIDYSQIGKEQEDV